MTEGQQEQPQEDVKPKINLVVDFEGQSECFLPRRVERPRRAATRRMHPPVCGCIRDPPPIYQSLNASISACTVKVKAGTPFKKLFEAAEVSLYFIPTSRRVLIPWTRNDSGRIQVRDYRGPIYLRGYKSMLSPRNFQVHIQWSTTATGGDSGGGACTSSIVTCLIPEATIAQHGGR